MENCQLTFGNNLGSTRIAHLEFIKQDTLPTFLQLFYVSTGCEFNLFFARIGKGSFLRAFYTHSEFVCCKCSLSDIDLTSEQGYFSFLRLIETAYFLLHRTAYEGTKSPIHLFHSKLEQHIIWLNKIKVHVWVHTKKLATLSYSTKISMAEILWVVHVWS